MTKPARFDRFSSFRRSLLMITSLGLAVCSGFVAAQDLSPDLAPLDSPNSVEQPITAASAFLGDVVLDNVAYLPGDQPIRFRISNHGPRTITAWGYRTRSKIDGEFSGWQGAGYEFFTRLAYSGSASSKREIPHGQASFLAHHSSHEVEISRAGLRPEIEAFEIELMYTIDELGQVRGELPEFARLIEKRESSALRIGTFLDSLTRYDNGSLDLEGLLRELSTLADQICGPGEPSGTPRSGGCPHLISVWLPRLVQEVEDTGSLDIVSWLDKATQMRDRAHQMLGRLGTDLPPI